MANYVVVMYLGRIMEEGPVDDIFHAPKHPYTKALLRSIPSSQKKPERHCQRSLARCRIHSIAHRAVHFIRVAQEIQPTLRHFGPRAACTGAAACGELLPAQHAAEPA